jgi:hypothetical protein
LSGGESILLDLPNHLGAQPHDQQQRRIGVLTESLVANFQAVGGGDPLAGIEGRLGHSASPAP